MKSKPLSEMTKEELQKNEKAMKTAVLVLASCVGLMFITGIYLTFKKGFSVSSVLPVAFLPLFGINLQNWKKVKAEIASRNE